MLVDRLCPAFLAASKQLENMTLSTLTNTSPIRIMDVEQHVKIQIRND